MRRGQRHAPRSLRFRDGWHGRSWAPAARSGGVSGIARRDHGISGRNASLQRSVSRREIVRRTRLSGKEQTIIDRFGEHRAAIGASRQRKRISAARIGVDAPAMHTYRLQPPGKVIAEELRQFRSRKVKQRVVTLALEFPREASAEINFDVRPSERPQMVSGRSGAIGMSKHPRVGVEFLGMIESKKQLIVQSEWQAGRGLGLPRQCWREDEVFAGQNRRGDGNDGAIRGHDAFGGFNAQPLAAVVYAMDRALQRRRYARRVLAYDRSEPGDNAPIDAGVFVGVEILDRETFKLAAADLGSERRDQAVPAVARFEQTRRRNAGRFFRGFADAGKKRLARFVEGILFRARKSDGERTALPRRH